MFLYFLCFLFFLNHYIEVFFKYQIILLQVDILCENKLNQILHK
jgi:hypothetical protein